MAAPQLREPMTPAPDELALRIIVEDPLPGVALALQRGPDGIEPPSITTPAQVAFDFLVRVGKPQANGQPTLLGPYTQGPPATRFIYITVGQRAGQPTSPWARRAKIPLAGISRTLVAAAQSKPGQRLEARFPGRGKDGSPTCASVKLPPDAWTLAK
ncbi:MAG: hypothetical protein KA180_15785 [Gemmatimonadales bacterium]|nr:hypothetical protein [Gemmatimonadales bacterium]